MSDSEDDDFDYGIDDGVNLKNENGESNFYSTRMKKTNFASNDPEDVFDTILDQTDEFIEQQQHQAPNYSTSTTEIDKPNGSKNKSKNKKSHKIKKIIGASSFQAKFQWKIF